MTVKRSMMWGNMDAVVYMYVCTSMDIHASTHYVCLPLPQYRTLRQLNGHAVFFSPYSPLRATSILRCMPLMSSSFLNTLYTLAAVEISEG